MKERFERIKTDLSSGAAQLAGLGVDIMAEALRESDIDTPEKTIYFCREMAKVLMNARPSMVPIGNWAITFLKELELEMGHWVDMSSTVHRARQSVLDRKSRIDDQLVDHSKSPILGMSSILTVSYSSTVCRILLGATNAKIIIAESRPAMEGRMAAEALIRAKRDISVITDAQIGLAVARVDAVLIGADSIANDLAVINKTGSFLAALAAREAGKPVFVAADTFKVNPDLKGAEIELEAKAGAEVWGEHPEICANVYFEPVPANLITAYITEKGLRTHDEMKPEIEFWKTLRDEELRK